MDLQLHKPGEHNYIHSISSQGIRVVDTVYVGAVILSPDELIENWKVGPVQELVAADFEPVFELGPEVVLLGTGERQTFLSPELMMSFYHRGIGIEAMTTEAAARTFNVLVSESRNVVAALLPLNP